MKGRRNHCCLHPTLLLLVERVTVYLVAVSTYVAGLGLLCWCVGKLGLAGVLVSLICLVCL